VRGKGIGNFAEAQDKSERSRAKDSSPWFCPVCRAKAGCGKKPFCRLDFLLLFDQVAVAQLRLDYFQ
jgi:hypothetical protein